MKFVAHVYKDFIPVGGLRNVLGYSAIKIPNGTLSWVAVPLKAKRKRPSS